MNRRTLLLAPAAVLGTAMLGAAAYVALRPEPDGSQGMASIGGPFRLLAAGGREVTDAEFRGRFMLVYFGYTRCPDACPTALQDIANALDMLPPEARARIAVLFITIDPEHDTPAVVTDYVSAFDIPITALSGTPDQVATAARAYRVYYAKHQKPGGTYDMDHSSIIYLMDKQGRFIGNFSHETPPQAIAAKLRTAMG